MSRSTLGSAVGSALPARRRLDRLLSDRYLADLEQLPLPALRARRREADQEAADLAYRDDLVQGRLAILRAEVERRAAGAPAGDLLRRLPEILAGEDRAAQPPQPPQPAGQPARLSLRAPNLLDRARRLEDKLLADTALLQLQAGPEEDLHTRLATVTELGAVLTGRRRRVEQVLDLLSTELARRYRVGDARVEDLLIEHEVRPG